MAALTADSKKESVFGDTRVVVADLPAVSDADTFDTGLKVDVAFALVVPKGPDAVAADSISVASISGDTLTFQVAGTARPATVLVFTGSA